MFMECCIYVLLSIMFIEKLLVCYCVVFMFIDYVHREAKYCVVLCSFLSTILFFGLPSS